jgi:predicted ATPase
MVFKRLQLKNWKNFLEADIDLGSRLFIIGPNASGKSNLLDAFRFLRDLVKPGGGLQKAVEDRGGIGRLRCIHSRRNTDISFDIELNDEEGTNWNYRLVFNQKTQIPKRLIIKEETVLKNGIIIINRPEPADKEDEIRLTQTHLEQVNANKDFRIIAEFFSKIQYMHLVPQLIRFGNAFQGKGLPDDPYGQHFLDRIVKTSEKVRLSRLRKIEEALHYIVPNLEKLDLEKDQSGFPHLSVVYSHWRKSGSKQTEEQFSDGTLRVIGLLWVLMENNSLLLLEEPELSLHDAIVTKLPSLIFRMQKEQSQVILSTHSPALLSDPGIGAEEIVVLKTEHEGTSVFQANSIDQIKHLMTEGFSAAEAALPYTRPNHIEGLELFHD